MDQTTPPRNEKAEAGARVLAIVLAVVSAIALIVAVTTKSWLANPLVGELQFGPLGAHSCNVLDVCESRTNGAFMTWFRESAQSIGYGSDVDKYTSSVFAPLGYVTFAAGIIGALGLLVAAAFVVRRKRPDLAIAPTTVALLGLFVALIVGCVFVATKPGPPGMVGAAWGFWVFGAATVVGISAAMMLAKQLRPLDVDDAAD